MKKKYLLSSLAFLFLLACTSENNSGKSSEGIAQTESKAEQDLHTAIQARDHIGLYQGVLPCADCEGIETSLYLMANNAYLLTKVYKGKADHKAFKNIGDFTWNAEGTTVTLSNMENAPNQFIVEESRAIQLDMEGKRVEGDLAAMYILSKQ